jgi:hypothetical protein
VTGNVVATVALWIGVSALILVVLGPSFRPLIFARIVRSFDRTHRIKLPWFWKAFWLFAFIAGVLTLMLLLCAGIEALTETPHEDSPLSLMVLLLGLCVAGMMVDYAGKKALCEELTTLHLGYDNMLKSTGLESDAIPKRLENELKELEPRAEDTAEKRYYKSMRAGVVRRLLPYAESLTYDGLKRRIAEHPSSVLDRPERRGSS